MLYVVEIRLTAEKFREFMGRLRTWLDDAPFRPRTLRYSLSDPDTVLRIDFDAEAEAHAFAQVFGGVVLV